MLSDDPSVGLEMKREARTRREKFAPVPAGGSVWDRWVRPRRHGTRLRILLQQFAIDQRVCKAVQIALRKEMVQPVAFHH